MINVISGKIITALKSDPLINEERWREILMRLQNGPHIDPRAPGTHPFDSTEKTYDSGKPRLNFIGDESTGGPGMGSETRPPNEGTGIIGERSSGDPSKKARDRLTSDNPDGSRTREEGIGQKKPIVPDGENINPYYMTETSPLWMDHRMKGQIGGDRDTIQGHLNTTLKGPSVKRPHGQKGVQIFTDYSEDPSVKIPRKRKA